jgi:hypothetical protein
VQTNSPALLDYLFAQSPLFGGKFLELRATVTDWLAYIPQTFPHYTRHTVKHSDSIILQLSKLLFRDDDVHKPPGGHFKFPHPWPGQTPPLDSGGTQ